MVKDWVPHAYEAFEDYRLGAAQFSKQGMEASRRMLAGENVSAKDVGMSDGEWREFEALLNRA